ncbi:Peroxidase, family 2 [Rhizoctonia solani]|uniref:Peroxidase, family 2 n=1 Tax=Rhizoctonia solani TaxID=456999 RepID=A0A8H7IAN7_9AGAM|nr:Peroxidase, family 2 [Rhizoctonia solani]
MRVLLMLYHLLSLRLSWPSAVGGSKSSESSGCPYAANAAKLKRQSNAASLATFDPVKQKVDVTGEHAFQPPRAGDKRGPCPGLNVCVLATQRTEETNHQFTGSRESWVSSSQRSAVYDGNPLTLDWSIGASDQSSIDWPGSDIVENRRISGRASSPPLLSAPQGLSGSHNKYEGDASATRADAYMNNGDASSLNLTYFKQLYDLQPDPSANFDYDIIIQHRLARRQYSVSTNPHFFNGPFSGFIALPAAYSFITRFMSNYSAEHPEGILNHDVLKSFYGVSGSGNNLTYQRGYEYNTELDDNEAEQRQSQTGKVNSFAGVNVGDITGGVYNSANLLEGNNLICFAFQAAQQAIPDVLKGILGDLTAALGLWAAKITPALLGLGCPELTKYDRSVLGSYPGSGGGAL